MLPTFSLLLPWWLADSIPWSSSRNFLCREYNLLKWEHVVIYSNKIWYVRDNKKVSKLCKRLGFPMEHHAPNIDFGVWINTMMKLQFDIKPNVCIYKCREEDIYSLFLRSIFCKLMWGSNEYKNAWSYIVALSINIFCANVSTNVIL